MRHKGLSRKSIVVTCMLLAAVVCCIIILSAAGAENDDTIPPLPVDENGQLNAQDGETVIGEFGISGAGESIYIDENGRDYATPLPPEPVEITVFSSASSAPHDRKVFTPANNGKVFMYIHYEERITTDVTMYTHDSFGFGWKIISGIDSSSTPTVKWESSDESVFIIDPDTGQMIATGRGIAYCTATAEILSANDTVEYATAECIVRVCDPR